MNVRSVGRFEWEQILRRMRLGGLIAGSGRVGKNGRPTRGGVSGTTFMAVAMVLASYGDLSGAEIYPGDAAVAIDCETSLKTVSDIRAKLIDLGMLTLVAASTRKGGSHWHLSLPTDFPASITVLTPAQHQVAARVLKGKARGSIGGSGGYPNESGLGGPVDTPIDQEADDIGGSGGPTETAIGVSGGPTLGGPVDSLTKPLPSHKDYPANSDEDLRTAVTLTREDDDSRPARCPHGNNPRPRKGTNIPRCEQCRAEANQAPEAETPTVAESIPVPFVTGPSRLTKTRCGPHNLPAANCNLCRRGLPGRAAA